VNQSVAHGGDPGVDRLLPVTSWALYDFANTIFYAVVVTLCLPPHILGMTGKHTFINWGFVPAMLAAAFVAPWLGGFVGHRGLSKKAVLLLTLLCAASTACLAAVRSPWALVGVFAAAQVFYQLALVPYNNLLPAVASPGKMGRVSGLGVGLGYVGVIVSIWFVKKLMDVFPGYSTAYLAAAVLFALFTIPFWCFVPEKPLDRKTAPPRLRDSLSLLKNATRVRFVIGNFLCADALNAIFIFMVPFLSKGLGYDNETIIDTLIFLNLAAFPGGLLCGVLADLFTPRRTMIVSAILLGSAIGIAQFSGLEAITFWSIVLLGGPGVAGLWVAGRKRVVQLAPEGETGSLFGVYGLTNKLSLVNFIFFSLLADLTGGYTWSVIVLLASLALGVAFLWSARGPVQRSAVVSEN